MILTKKMLHLVFQGIAMLSLRYFFARLSGTINIAVPARLSDTLPHLNPYLSLFAMLHYR